MVCKTYQTQDMCNKMKTLKHTANLSFFGNTGCRAKQVNMGCVDSITAVAKLLGYDSCKPTSHFLYLGGYMNVNSCSRVKLQQLPLHQLH